MRTVTCVAPVNIAVVKYWGKRNEDLILPLNDSISSTLNHEYMCAKTTIMASPGFEEDKFWLNGKEESLENRRLQNCLREIKTRVGAQAMELVNLKIHICSENNFPTAAGLASSAAGYACLVYALAALYNVQDDISAVARMGSGSACRSIYGGWVRWHMGIKEDGSDSIATQIAPASHWPEMRILVLVVNDARKKDGSTPGMQRSVATSELLKYRAKYVVPDRVEAMVSAIKAKDFDAFARLTMQDSNQFHAVCLDTFPPCVYMNDVSHAIAQVVHACNAAAGSNMVAYTFDAGPNACLYTLKNNVSHVVAALNEIFPSTSDDYLRGIPVIHEELADDWKSKINLPKQKPDSIKYLIHTRVGEGPKILGGPAQHLLDERGQPRHHLL